VDPDGDVPRYSIHPMVPAAGAPAGEEESLPFQVDPLSGEVSLSAKLDREQKDKYSMVINQKIINYSLNYITRFIFHYRTLSLIITIDRHLLYLIPHFFISSPQIITAEDDEGLRGSVTLDVIIADVNDEAPVFRDLPYSFRVDEGKEGALLGVVKVRQKYK